MNSVEGTMFLIQETNISKIASLCHDGLLRLLSFSQNFYSKNLQDSPFYFYLFLGLLLNVHCEQ